ncbi:hypothetical protein HMPREF3224_01518 [Anaerococcus hydrogenalis]|nr:hypothetical protein HMPREF3224_01518 [Anaerococcus hydrogenalis]
MVLLAFFLQNKKGWDIPSLGPQKAFAPSNSVEYIILVILILVKDVFKSSKVLFVFFLSLIS